ncbi:TPA: hypothetical protein DF272_04710 [Candidatus Falkowbacteria bacterium]|nr:hypothetical protein [Candidatus Falkowbacteria bacterium]
MENLRPLLQRADDVRHKPKNDEISAEEFDRRKQERKEYHLQAMEVIIEIAEDVLWGKVFEKYGPDEIVQEVLARAEAQGAVPSEKQKGWLYEKVLLWTIDVGDMIKAIEFLRTIGEITATEVEKKNLQKDAEIFELIPWMLLEFNPVIQKEFLRFLPAKSTNSDDFEFIVNRPPMVIVRCKKDEDYIAIGGARNAENSLGLASRKGFLIEDERLPKDLRCFGGRIGIVRNSADKMVELHEWQHLFYGRYMADKKAQDLRVLDELQAYLTDNREYRLDESAIFSDERFSKFQMAARRYSDEWLELRFELIRLREAGVEPKKVASKLMVSDTMAEAASRLKRIKIETDELKIASSESLEWALLGTGENRPKVEYSEETVKYFNGLVAEAVTNINKILGQNEAIEIGRLSLIKKVLLYISGLFEAMRKACPEIINERLIYQTYDIGQGYQVVELSAVATLHYHDLKMLVGAVIPDFLKGNNFPIDDLGTEAEPFDVMHQNVGKLIKQIDFVNESSANFYDLTKHYRVDPNMIALVAEKQLTVKGYDSMDVSEQNKIIEMLCMVAAALHQETQQKMLELQAVEAELEDRGMITYKEKLHIEIAHNWMSIDEFELNERYIAALKERKEWLARLELRDAA